MGNRIIHLADHLPSYRRRPRALSAVPPAPTADTNSPWSALARERAIRLRQTPPGADQAMHRPPPVLRITRLVDATETSSPFMGRVRISGRLIDVCAELERMAAAEAAAQARSAA